NPVNNMMYVPLILEKGAVITMDIYNILGVKVYRSGEMNFTAGNHLILRNIDLNSGQYLVSIKENNGNTLNTKRIVVVK
ncbi:MAG: T9SS type A sorting domain-containing protein, partial [Bacteroidota bacterium]|nr:T9SS type A sorting domain-containing protein [Bacteroidota bacterium]